MENYGGNIMEVLSTKISTILNYPLAYRCEELSMIAVEWNNKELQHVFPVIVESIFGINSQVGWGLRSVTRTEHSYEFKLLVNLLKPDGHIFRMCYKLLSDCYLRFEFPINFLPAKIRQMIDEGMAPSFYVDKLQLDYQTRMPNAIVLNAFEFYIFHFAYHMVNPWLQKPVDTWNMMDTVYIQLAEMYLNNFLPCDGSAVEPMLCNLICKLPARSPVPYQNVNRPARTPTLFRSSVVLNQNSVSSGLHNIPNSPNQAASEVWRTETVIQSFLDFWLVYKESEMLSPGLSILQREILPSVEHIRVVRNLIKHLHYFVNSCTGEVSNMDELKRSVLRASQSKIYNFLRHMIRHWPLDTSFKIVLETWLSYIQPWRYTDIYNMNPLNRHLFQSERDCRSVDSRWQSFISDNILFYTSFFQQIIPRFSRMDLTALKNAHMVNRVTKVFSSRNLAPLISEIEKSLDDTSLKLHYFGDQTNQSGFDDSRRTANSESVSPGRSHHWNISIRQQIQDLEGSGFEYTPLFSFEARKEVENFITYIQVARLSALKAEEKLKLEKKNGNWNWFVNFKNHYWNQCYLSKDGQELSVNDWRKVIMFLNTVLEQLATIFGIRVGDVPDSASKFNVYCSAASVLEKDMTISNDTLDSSFHNLLLTRGSKLKKKEIQYEGNPDLLPIGSNEIGILVRLFFQISNKLNKMYVFEMCALYHRHDFVGKVARQILHPPTVIRTFDKRISFAYSPRVETLLSPRISLRCFANRTVLMIIFFGMLIAWLLNYPTSTYCVTILFVAIGYILLKAALEPWLIRNEQRSPPWHNFPRRSEIQNEQ